VVGVELELGVWVAEAATDELGEDVGVAPVEREAEGVVEVEELMEGDEEDEEEAEAEAEREVEAEAEAEREVDEVAEALVSDPTDRETSVQSKQVPVVATAKLDVHDIDGWSHCPSMEMTALQSLKAAVYCNWKVSSPL
jgi:hypothetical protein